MKAVPRRIANIGVLPGSPGSLPRLPRAVILALSTDKRGTPPPGDKSPFPKKTGAPNRARPYIIIYNIAGQTLRSRRTEGCPPARPASVRKYHAAKTDTPAGCPYNLICLITGSKMRANTVRPYGVYRFSS